MMLEIYLIGAALAFVLSMAYFFLRWRTGVFLAADLIVLCFFTALSWISIIMIIPSIKIAYRQYKELKDYQNIRMNPHVGSQPPRRVPEISQKQFKGNEILKPIKSSELQKSIESFSEN